MKSSDDAEIRRFCSGMPRLDATLTDWMVRAIKALQLQSLVQQHGSPVNVVETTSFAANAAALNRVAEKRYVDFQIYFARKANKCLSFVDAACDAGCGIDTASLNELKQALQRGVPPEKTVCTAAIKSAELLTYCIRNKVPIVVDNEDEWRIIECVASDIDIRANVHLRLSGFEVSGSKLESRFGIDIDDAVRFVARVNLKHTRVEGLHFHLDGYSAAERVAAVEQSINLAEVLRKLGHGIASIDIGGGFPVCYLRERSQWERFWTVHRESLLGQRSPITYRKHALGYIVHDGELIGDRQAYPFWQPKNKEEWLAGILDATVNNESGATRSLGERIRTSNLQLRCEPGRAMLEGCGMTVARVEFCKRMPDGDSLIGVAMNRTQCRTSSDDFLVDPIVVKSEASGTTPAREGYLVGAYCTESELLCLRKLSFPDGVGRGDLIVFPNTAGYFMHFLESRSHQFPLAKNIVADRNWTLDPID